MNEYKKEKIRNIHYNNKNEIQFEYGGQVHHYRMETLKEVFVNCWNLQQENEQLKEELKYTVPIVEHNKIVSKKLKENQKYKEVIDKAMEYINKNLILVSILDGVKTFGLNSYTFDYKELLDILKEVE